MEKSDILEALYDDLKVDFILGIIFKVFNSFYGWIIEDIIAFTFDFEYF
jgi:hypothetical protein